MPRLAAVFLALGAALAQPLAPAPASPPPQTEVWLTGSQVSPFFVEQAVARALAWEGREGVRVPPQLPLRYEERRDLLAGDLNVRLSPAAYPEHAVNQLILSNKPEAISATRGLLHYPFKAGGAVRLIYHHKNTGTGPLDLELRLMNPSSQDVWVWVSDAWAGPTPDEVFVGHTATKRWLDLYWNQAGQLIPLPPGAEYRLSRATLRPNQVVSGLLQATVAQGQGAVLDLVARAPGEDFPPLETYTQAPVYRLDAVETRVTQTFRAGGSLQLSLGDAAFQNGAGGRIAGSWGKFYTYDLNLENPTPSPQTVALQLSADGGVARGVVLLQGQSIELPLLRPGNGFELTRLTLAPGARQRLTLTTLPASGSNYPLRLLLFNPAVGGEGSP